MPAAAIIVPLAVSAASTAATTALVGATLTATLGVVGGAIVTGAIGGAIGGAITGGIEGGDIGMEVLTGAVQGAVSSGAGAELAGSPTQGVTSTIENITGLAPKEAGSIATGLIKGGSTLAGSTIGNLVGGQNVGTALKGGAVSGIASGVASGVGNEVFGGSQPIGPTERQPGERIPSDNSFNGTTFPIEREPASRPSFLNQQIQNASTGALQQGIQTGLNDLLGPSPSGGGQSATSNLTTPSNFNPTPTDVALGGGSPSVAALAQALRTVPDLGYSPGGPVFGSDASKANRKVWNKASLRVTDDQNQ